MNPDFWDDEYAAAQLRAESNNYVNLRCQIDDALWAALGAERDFWRHWFLTLANTKGDKRKFNQVMKDYNNA